MIHTGVTSTGCLSSARNNLSFLSSVIKKFHRKGAKDAKEKQTALRAELHITHFFALFAPLR
jgi:hypothetical protein